MRNKNIIVITITLLLAVLLFSGCHRRTLEENWGRSYEAARYNQILNPDAPANLEPTTMDGQAAETGLETYRSGFKEQKGEDVYNLDIGFGKN